jgi:hypothetical protein
MSFIWNLSEKNLKFFFFQYFFKEASIIISNLQQTVGAFMIIPLPDLIICRFFILIQREEICLLHSTFNLTVSAYFSVGPIYQPEEFKRAAQNIVGIAAFS